MVIIIVTFRYGYRHIVRVLFSGVLPVWVWVSTGKK